MNLPREDRSAVLELKEMEVGSSPSRQITCPTQTATTRRVAAADRTAQAPAAMPPSIHTKDEWLIDNSTSRLYLSLLSDQDVKNRGGQVRPAPRAIPGSQDDASLIARARENPEPMQVSIGLDEGAESTTRFVSYAALLVGFSLLIYVAISRSGQSPNSRSAQHPRVSGRLQMPPSAKPASGMNPPATSSSNLPDSDVPVTEPSLTLIPTLILDASLPNQSSTHTLVVHNRTSFEMVFDVEARDLVLRGGKPAYLPPGQVEGSAAATLAYSTRTLELKPMQSASLDVTLTMPDKTAVKGVAILLNPKGTMFPSTSGSIAASLGSIISFGDRATGDDRQGPASTVTAEPTLTISQWVIDPPRPCPGSDPSVSLREGEGLEGTAGDLQ